MRASSIKAWFLVHKWTSLVCTLFMLLLCVTGLPLIFAHEIDHLLERSIEPPELAPTDARIRARADVDAIVADASARRPSDAVKFLVADPEEPEFWFVTMGERLEAPEASAFYFYDARTGDFLHEYPLGEGVMNLLLRLHVDMFAGLPGTLFLGFMGLLLVVAIVSGVVLYGPYMTRLRFGTIRRERSPRLKWLDLHNMLGIVTLVWLSVVGLTGVINTLSIPIFGQWQNTQLVEMAAPYSLPTRAGTRRPSPRRVRSRQPRGRRRRCASASWPFLARASPPSATSSPSCRAPRPSPPSCSCRSSSTARPARCSSSGSCPGT